MALTIPWLNKGKSNLGRVAVSLGPDGIGLAHVNESGQLSFCQFYDQLGDTEELLKEITEQQDWQGVACSIVLHPVYYHLVLAESPEVKGDELSSAIRWKIKELLDFPVEEAAIEYFMLPDDAYRGRQKMLYAAALRKVTLESLVDPVERSGLNVDCVEISELAIHNIASRYPTEAGGTAVLQLYEGEGYINLMDGGQIYLTRRLDIGLDKYQSGKNNTDFFDTLFLEIKRSLDYYESQLGKGIITQLFYSPGMDNFKPIGDFLSSQLGLHVEPINFSTLDISDELSADQMLMCASAVGAALGPVKPKEAARAAS
jgi:MSHA biogenesis protein MshI